MIWVIGSNGILGSELCRQFEKKKIPFVSSDIEVDITNAECIESFIRKQESTSYLTSSKKVHDDSKIKWIINCAGYNDIEKAETDPETAEKINASVPENIAHIARFNNIKVIQISTDFVFNTADKIPLTETTPKNPATVFGKTKSAGEDYITQGMTQYYIIRTSWLYGDGNSSFVYKMLKSMQNNSEITVNNDRIIVPTYAGDLAETVITLIEKADKNASSFNAKDIISFGIYNYSNQGETSKSDYIQKIYSLAKKYKRISNDCKINSDNSNENTPLYSVLSSEKIIRELKIKIPSWEKSLEKFIKSDSFSLN